VEGSGNAGKHSEANLKKCPMAKIKFVHLPSPIASALLPQPCDSPIPLLSVQSGHPLQSSCHTVIHSLGPVGVGGPEGSTKIERLSMGCFVRVPFTVDLAYVSSVENDLGHNAGTSLFNFQLPSP